MTKQYNLETLAVHAGLETDPATGAVTPPIHLSTTFEREKDGTFPHGHVYTRTSNPNRVALEEALARLEGGSSAAAFSSGSAAAGAVFRALRPGDHAVVPDDMYHGIAKLLKEVFIPWGLAVDFVDLTDLDALRSSIRKETKLVWLETPSNPLLKITNIAAVADVAHEAGAVVASDSTWTPPPLQPVFDLGVDFTVHSTTKYLSGHSDVLGGAVVAKEESGLLKRIRTVQTIEGAVPSPFDCWLVLRGLRTLPYRMRAHCENAQKLAEFLAEHPQVEAVHYPSLETHPGHEVAKKQMNGFGGMLSFRVKGSAEKATNVAANVELFTRATSLGGVESLIEHRASIEGPQSQTPQNLLRVSVGLEHPDDLIGDLGHALASLN